MADVVRDPRLGGALQWRVRMDFGGGVVAAVDVLREPTHGFVAELEGLLTQAAPLLREQHATLLQFGVESRIAPPPEREETL
jgi:hypothetical protein